MSTLANRKKAKAGRKQKLAEKVQSQKSNTSFEDSRMWRCQRDKSGKGDAVIRFLEPTEADIKWYVEKFDFEEEEAPFYINYHKHAFKGTNGKWMIENCPTSIMEAECPVCEANGEIVDAFGGWDAVDDNHPGKKLVRNRKRKETYVANVLIVSDKANPENEGQVKLFQYGKAIHDMVMAQLIPEFEDEDACDVSDYWEGRNFKLKIIQKDGYANYDKSSWGDSEPVHDSDDEIEALLNKQYDLNPIVGDDKYKSYEDLTKQFEKTQGAAKSKRKTVDDAGEDGGEDSGAGGDQTPEPAEKKPTRKPRKAAAKKEAAEPAAGGDSDEAYFQSLMDD